MKNNQSGFMLLDVIAAIFITALSVTVIAESMSLLLKRFSVSASNTKIALASASILEKLADSKKTDNRGEEGSVVWHSEKKCGNFGGRNRICKLTLFLKSGSVEHVIITYTD